MLLKQETFARALLPASADMPFADLADVTTVVSKPVMCSVDEPSAVSRDIHPNAVHTLSEAKLDVPADATATSSAYITTSRSFQDSFRLQTVPPFICWAYGQILSQELKTQAFCSASVPELPAWKFLMK